MENYLLLIPRIIYWRLPLCQTLCLELLAQELKPELRLKRGNWQADPPTFDSVMSSVKTLRKGIWLSINWRKRLILDVSPKKRKLQIIYMRITVIAILKEAATTSSRGHIHMVININSIGLQGMFLIKNTVWMDCLQLGNPAERKHKWSLLHLLYWTQV